MKLEPASQEIVNQLFKLTKLHSLLEEFSQSDALAVHCVLSPGEYSSIHSAQASFAAAIKRFGYPFTARTINGNLYLIKTKESI